MTDRELMQQALEVLERCPALYKAPEAATALRERLSQPEQEPVDSPEKAGAYMDARLWEFIDMAAAWPEAKTDTRTWDHVLVYAPKQLEQEPVATVVARQYEDGTYAGNALDWAGRNCEDDLPVGTKLYTSQHPKQEQEPFCFYDGRNIVGKEYADHSDVFPLYTSPNLEQQKPVRFKCTVVDDAHPNGVPLSQWGKQHEMQPCAGRNCGSTNPNLHSAECFEDYEKATGMNQRKPLTVTKLLPRKLPEDNDD